MLEKDHIICVYNYLKINGYKSPKRDVEEQGYSYYILYLMDASGQVDREFVSKLYLERYKQEISNKKRYIGPFNNLDEVRQFAFQACQELDGSKVFLLSPEEFQEALEETANLSEMAEKIMVSENHIENIDKTASKNSIFSKMFS